MRRSSGSRYGFTRGTNRTFTPWAHSSYLWAVGRSRLPETRNAAQRDVGEAGLLRRVWWSPLLGCAPPSTLACHAVGVGVQSPIGKLILFCKVFICKIFLFACFSLKAKMGEVLELA